MKLRLPIGPVTAFICSIGIHGIVVWKLPDNGRIKPMDLASNPVEFTVQAPLVAPPIELNRKQSSNEKGHQSKNSTSQRIRMTQRVYKKYRPSISERDEPICTERRRRTSNANSNRSRPSKWGYPAQKKRGGNFLTPSQVRLSTDSAEEDRNPSDPDPPALPTQNVTHPSFSHLSPRAAAALTMMDDLSFECTPRCSKRDPEESKELDGDRLQEYLSQVANQRPHLRRRDPPELHRQSDGSYRFEGHAFTAHIAKDGKVSFEDREVTTVFPLFSSDDSNLGKQNLLDMEMDLNDAVENRVWDKEIYTYEKQRFLRETAELRQQLATAYRSVSEDRAKRRLLGRLILIKENESHPIHAKHRLIFALWDDCSGDEIGRQAQELIERFVREEMPQGSSLGYSAEEIRSLNRSRISQPIFNPYKSASFPDSERIQG